MAQHYVYVHHMQKPSTKRGALIKASATNKTAKYSEGGNFVPYNVIISAPKFLIISVFFVQ